MTGLRIVNPGAVKLAEIAAEDRDYYIDRVRYACAAAVKAADPAVVDTPLAFAHIYLTRLLTSVEMQIDEAE